MKTMMTTGWQCYDRTTLLLRLAPVTFMTSQAYSHCVRGTECQELRWTSCMLKYLDHQFPLRKCLSLRSLKDDPFSFLFDFCKFKVWCQLISLMTLWIYTSVLPFEIFELIGGKWDTFSLTHLKLYENEEPVCNKLSGGILAESNQVFCKVSVTNPFPPHFIYCSKCQSSWWISLLGMYY